MNCYTMFFALSPKFDHVLLLHKPLDHPNPLFRNRWTAPGGLIEPGESELEGALREMQEETLLQIPASEARYILTFSCGCDPSEAVHHVAVYAAVLPVEILRTARGQAWEPVSVFADLPTNSLWYVEPLLALVAARLKQMPGTANKQPPGSPAPAGGNGETKS